MRPIKFRAWDLQDRKWIDQNVAIADWFNSPYFNLACITGKESEILELRESLRFSWLQFTGLKDKNGKEVYEGDIIERRTRRRHVVLHDQYTAGFILGNHFTKSIADALKNGEVIGNVYENPELLK